MFLAPDNTTEAGIDYRSINLINYNAIGPADGVTSECSFLSYRGFNVNQSNLVPVRDASDGGFYVLFRAMSTQHLINPTGTITHLVMHLTGTEGMLYSAALIPLTQKSQLIQQPAILPVTARLPVLQPLALTLRQQ